MKVLAAEFDLFRDLSSASIDVRRSAASSLLQRLGQNVLAVDYVLKRLCRGLCSSSGCARQGFASALTAILLHTDLISNESLGDALKEHLFLPKQPSRQDRKDLLLGWYGCCR